MMVFSFIILKSKKCCTCYFNENMFMAIQHSGNNIVLPLIYATLNKDTPPTNKKNTNKTVYYCKILL